MSTVTKWDERFFLLAANIASWSKDPRRKVGCVLVAPDRHRLATGYNGFPVNILDDPARLEGPDKNALMVHAELNAIFNARTNLGGWTMYVTSPPCSECAKAIIQAGIARVVHPVADPKSSWGASHELARLLLDEARVTVVEI